MHHHEHLRSDFSSSVYVVLLSLTVFACLTVSRVTRVSQGCNIELRIIIAAVSEEDDKTEIKCVTENIGGRQEVVTRLRLEGGWSFLWMTELSRKDFAYEHVKDGFDFVQIIKIFKTRQLIYLAFLISWEPVQQISKPEVQKSWNWYTCILFFSQIPPLLGWL